MYDRVELEENIEDFLYYLGVGKTFLNITTVYKPYMNASAHLRLCPSKNTVNNVNGQTIEIMPFMEQEKNVKIQGESS